MTNKEVQRGGCSEWWRVLIRPRFYPAFQNPHSNSWEEIEFVKVLGRGKFGEVVLTKHTEDECFYAVKKISKRQIVERKNKESVHNEIMHLLRMRHPFIAHLFGYFQDEDNVNLILEYCAGGELYNRMRRSVKFTNDEARFYTAEIALALSYMHSKPLSIVYRDLKPENVMLDWTGHVKLVDFGFAVPIKDSESVTGGCGTAMYIAPEIASGHKGNTHGFPVDWWAVGIMIYEFLTGRAPFGDSSDLTKFEILNNINAGKIKWQSSINKAAKGLIQTLLDPDPSKRSGYRGVEGSSWMEGVSFDDVLNRRVLPPWVPKGMDEVGDASNFLNWKELPKPEAPFNSSPAYVNERLYQKIGGGDGVVCSEAYDKGLAVEKTGKGRKEIGGGGEKGFAATAGAVNMMKRRTKSLKQKQKQKNSSDEDRGGGDEGGGPPWREDKGSRRQEGPPPQPPPPPRQRQQRREEEGRRGAGETRSS